jgi:glutathione-regulated potassium-efflux system protein KefB
MALVETAQRHFPKLKIFARALDRTHAYELFNAGVTNVHREVFSSSVDLARDALAALGHHPFEAQRAANLFRAIDERLLRSSAPHHGDQTKLIDIARTARAEIANVLGADRGVVRDDGDPAWHAPERDEA